LYSVLVDSVLVDSCLVKHSAFVGQLYSASIGRALNILYKVSYVVSEKIGVVFIERL